MQLLKVLCCVVTLVFTFAHAQWSAKVSGRALQGFEKDTLRWQREYPVSGGALFTPMVIADQVWLANGYFVEVLDVRQGITLERYYFPAPIQSFERSEAGLVVQVNYGGNSKETFTVGKMGIQGRVVYPPLPEMTRALEKRSSEGLLKPLWNKDAKQGETLKNRLYFDPHNPFLLLYYARYLQLIGQIPEATLHYKKTVQQVDYPFFVYFRLAVMLDTIGQNELANQALRLAQHHWVKSLYDPEIPVSDSAWDAYGDPISYLRKLFNSHPQRAGEWLGYITAIAPKFENHQKLYESYATWLESQGRTGEALNWRNTSKALADGTLFQLGQSTYLQVQKVAQFGSMLGFITLVGLWLTLHLRYWGVQHQDLKSHGGIVGSLWRNPSWRLRHTVLSYASFTEKLVLITTYIMVLFSLALWSWAAKTQNLTRLPVFNMGTYGGVWFYDQLNSVKQESIYANYLQGVAVQMDGDTERAKSFYQKSTTIAGVLNNSGVIAKNLGNDALSRELYQQALSLDPNLIAPAYNLSLAITNYRGNFQNTFRQGQPRLAYPDAVHIARVVSTPIWEHWGKVLLNPWRYVQDVPTGLPYYAQMAWISALFVAIVLTLLWVVVPRPRSVQGYSPRPVLYRVFAFLVPGVGLFDEVWGLVLYMVWAVLFYALGESFGLWSRGFFSITSSWLIPLVLGVYLLNTVVMVLEEMGIARKRKKLQQTR